METTKKGRLQRKETLLRMAEELDVELTFKYSYVFIDGVRYQGFKSAYQALFYLKKTRIKKEKNIVRDSE